MAADRFYVGPSAYLCVLQGGAGWQRIAAQLEGAHLLSSALLALEAERTLVHLSRSGGLTPAELQTLSIGWDAISSTSRSETSRWTCAVGGSCPSCRRRAHWTWRTSEPRSGSTTNRD